MTTISRPLITQRLKPGLNAILGQNYARYEGDWKFLVDTKKSERAFEESLHGVGMGLAARKAEGSQYTMDSFRDGLLVRTDMIEYGLGYNITRAAMEDNLYEGQAETGAKMMARSFTQRKETEVAALYNNGFSATGYDGVALFSNSHPHSDSPVGDNLVTAAALSQTTLEEMFILAGGFTDDRGLRVNGKLETLIVPRALIFDAFELTKSDLSTNVVSNTNLNNVNSIKGLGLFPKGVRQANFLTSNTAFFARTDVPDSMVLYQRNAFEFSMDYKDPWTGNIVCTGWERYGINNQDYRGVVGCAGA